MANRDTDCYLDIVARLNALGTLGTVAYGVPIEDVRAGGDSELTVSVMPAGWVENDAYDPIALERVVTGLITLEVRSQDPQERFTTADLAVAQIQNAIGGESLAGQTLPARTRVVQAVWAPVEHPAQIVRMTVKFTYFIDGYAAHDVTT